VTAARKEDSNPPDIDDLREEIAQTRAELGETVEALAAKADVKARLQEAKADAKAKAKDKAVEAKSKALDKAAEAKALVQAKASEVSGKLRTGAHDAGAVGATLAGRAQDKAVQVRDDARRRPVPYGVLAAGAALLAAVLIWRRRSR